MENIPGLKHAVCIQNVKAFICQLLSEMLPRNDSSSRQAVTNKIHRFCPG